MGRESAIVTEGFDSVENARLLGCILRWDSGNRLEQRTNERGEVVTRIVFIESLCKVSVPIEYSHMLMEKFGIESRCFGQNSSASTKRCINNDADTPILVPDLNSP